MSKIGFAFVVCGLVAGSAFGQAKKADAPTCPICHMPLSKKKTADNPVAVKLDKKSKVLYCCPKCTMPDSVLVKTKPAKAPKA
jgi:hypothetical protein